MKPEYLDEEMRRLAADPECQPAGWGGEECRQFRRLVQCARAAHIEGDLRNMRLLRIEWDGAADSTTARAKLSSGRTVDLTFKNADTDGVVVFGSLTSDTEAPR